MGTNLWNQAPAVESFIEHQDTCNASRPRAETSPASGGGGVGAAAATATSQQQQPHAAVSMSRTASSTSPSSELVISQVAWPGPAMASPTTTSAATAFHRFDPVPSPRTPSDHPGVRSMELQLMPPRGSCSGIAAPAVAYYGAPHSPAVVSPEADSMRLQLSIGFGRARDGCEVSTATAAARLKEEAREQLRLAVVEKAAADEARAQAKRQAELAEQELSSARRVRHQAQVELSRAHALRDHAVRQIDATLLQITCYGCRHKFRARAAAMSSEVASYVSSVVTEGGDAEVDNDEKLNADDMPSHAKMDIN